MRDHPAHSIEILGSGWGVRLASSLDRDMMGDAFRVAAKDKLFWAKRRSYGPDQGFLKRFVFDDYRVPVGFPMVVRKEFGRTGNSEIRTK